METDEYADVKHFAQLLFFLNGKRVNLIVKQGKAKF